VKDAADAAGFVASVAKDLEESVGDVTEVDRTIKPPPGWTSTELRFAFTAQGRRSEYRAAVFKRLDGGRMVGAVYYFDERRTDDAAVIAPRILESVRLEPGQ
jgi:hypothetical protein